MTNYKKTPILLLVFWIFTSVGFAEMDKQESSGFLMGKISGFLKRVGDQSEKTFAKINDWLAKDGAHEQELKQQKADKQKLTKEIDDLNSQLEEKKSELARSERQFKESLEERKKLEENHKLIESRFEKPHLIIFSDKDHIDSMKSFFLKIFGSEGEKQFSELATLEHFHSKPYANIAIPNWNNLKSFLLGSLRRHLVKTFYKEITPTEYREKMGNSRVFFKTDLAGEFRLTYQDFKRGIEVVQLEPNSIVCILKKKPGPKSAEEDLTDFIFDLLEEALEK